MNKKTVILASLVIFYFVIHLWQLTLLPVFADESIYIRWAQLAIDNWSQYLFFPLNDGKTPLFIWTLIPFQFIFSDQLFAARFVSVLVGLLQLFMTKAIVKELGGRTKAQWLSVFLVSILPFWYMYHRFALMDAMMCLCISMVIFGSIKMIQFKKNDVVIAPIWIAITGIALGLGIWTKLPAVFVIPALPFFVFLPSKWVKTTALKQLIAIGLSIFLGLVIFLSLKISPSFAQLFRRSSDFAFPIGEVLFQGKWRQTLPSIPTYLLYFFSYLTWPVIFLSFAGVFSKKNRRVTFVFLTVIAAFSGFFFLFGRVVYSRYFLPLALPFTVLTVLNAQVLFDKYFTQQQSVSKKIIAATVTTFLFGSIVSQSFQTILPSLMDSNAVPYVSSDREQYLTTWSSGIGISETVSYIHQQSLKQSIAVATEGRFGTLPDGLLLYFHRRDLNQIYIEGTAQYPVRSLPDFFIKRAKLFDQSILVVNSDRMQMQLNSSKLISEYCRAFNGSCLQIWDITQEVKAAP